MKGSLTPGPSFGRSGLGRDSRLPPHHRCQPLAFCFQTLPDPTLWRALPNLEAPESRSWWLASGRIRVAVVDHWVGGGKAACSGL